MYIEIDDVIGFQDLTLVGKGGSGVMNIDWFKLSDYEITPPPTPTPHPLPPTEIFPKVKAVYYDVQSGTQLVGNGAGAYIGHIDTNSYLTYNSLNFGPSGTTKSVKIRYAKATIDGQLELRIGGPTGALIGEYSPSNTGDWFNFTTVYIEIDDVIGLYHLHISVTTRSY